MLSLLAACTSTTAGSGAENTASGGSARPATSDATVLARIALTRADAKAPVTLMSGGDQVVGQVTLDNCGYDFTSEGNRVARRQFVVEDAAHPTSRVSNELVAYDTKAHAAQALVQWHRAAATCPHTPVHSSVDGVPPLTIKVTRNSSGAKTLPVKSNAITVESAEGSGEPILYNASFLQVKGRILDAVYLTSTSPITSASLARAQKLAVVTVSTTQSYCLIIRNLD